MTFSGQILSDLLSTLLSNQARGSSVEGMNQLFWPLRLERCLGERASSWGCQLPRRPFPLAHWQRPTDSGRLPQSRDHLDPPLRLFPNHGNSAPFCLLSPGSSCPPVLSQRRPAIIHRPWSLSTTELDAFLFNRYNRRGNGLEKSCEQFLVFASAMLESQ
jgi:hypothetical protein